MTKRGTYVKGVWELGLWGTAVGGRLYLYAGVLKNIFIPCKYIASYNNSKALQVSCED